jgi:hypothetical protein
LIANDLKKYVEAPTRREKSQIIDDIVSQIRCYGGFVKKTPEGRWLSIGSVQAREKVGHSFRDCMKLFKGKRPSTKEQIWEEAQNVIFSNLQLRTSPSSTCSVTSSSVTSSESVATPASHSQPMETPQPAVSHPAVVDENDPFPVDDHDSCGYTSLICGTQGDLLEWLIF